MNFSDVNQVSNFVSDLAGDVYQKRSRLAPKGQAIYLAYRISISDHTVDKFVNIYCHVVIVDHHIHYTISDKSSYQIDHDDLIFRHAEDDDWHVRGTSARHYIFGDLMKPALRAKLAAVASEMANPQVPHLHDTLPLTQFSPTDEACFRAGFSSLAA